MKYPPHVNPTIAQRRADTLQRINENRRSPDVSAQRYDLRHRIGQFGVYVGGAAIVFAGAVSAINTVDHTPNIKPAHEQHSVILGETVSQIAAELCPNNRSTAINFILTANNIADNRISLIAPNTMLTVPDPTSC